MRCDLKKVNFPLGASDFETIRKNEYFYIDKTALIEELYNNKGTNVFLFTRPRRFGKTMAMSMLSSFFDISKESRDIFDGLDISRNREICDNWMNKFPAVFVSFKNVDGLSFDDAKEALYNIVISLYDNYLFLRESKSITEENKIRFNKIYGEKASLGDIKESLSLLLRMLYAHYKRKVILLIDEYDVPMAKASEKGYYPQMLDVMKGILNVLKDNSTLHFGVVTGCLRIAKESIFTGLNNLYSNTITSNAFSEYFGFTPLEVERTFRELGCEDKLPLVKEWYDGYRFGKSEIYSPWDVISYLNDLKNDSDARPKNYWANTSGNAIISSFFVRGSRRLSNDLDTLLSGGYIIKTIDENITYDYLHSSEENLWSILFMTGYLTSVREEELRYPLSGDKVGMKIPNREIMSIFSSSLTSWIKDETRKYDLSALEDALWKGDVEKLAFEMTRLLNNTLSYHDVYHEYVYHVFFDGVFRGLGYDTESNREYGMGRPDIVVYDNYNMRVAVFEVKGINETLAKAVKQIEDRKYKDGLMDYRTLIIYGVRFDGKSAEVVLEDRIER